MGPKRALVDFRKLQNKHEKGKLSEKEFKKKVESIRATTKRVNWKVDTDGNWYKEVDDKWVIDNIDFNTQVSPQNLFQLVVMILKSVVIYLPKRLLLMAVITGVVFVIHTYLVIYPNGGYWPGTNDTLDNILAFSSNRSRGVAFWTIISYLLMALFRRISNLGIKKILSGCVTGPKRMFVSMKSKKENFLTYFLVTTPILLILGFHVIRNEALSYTLIIGAVLAIISFRVDLSYLVLRLGYQDIAKFFKLKKNKFNDIYFDSYQLSLITAMLLYIFLPKKTYIIYFVAISLVGILFYKRYNKSKKLAEKVSMLMLFAFNFGLLYTIKVHADDGGVAEAGGFIQWFNSPGAFTAVTIGMPPAIGAGLGGLIATITEGAEFVDTFVYDDLEDIAEDIVEGVDEVIEEGSEYLDDTLEGIDEAIEEGSEYLDDAIETIEEGIEEGSEYLDDAIETIEEGIEEGSEYLDDLIEDFEDGVDSGLVVLEDGLEGAGDILEDLYTAMYGSPEDRLDALSDLGETFTSGQDLILTSGAADLLFDSFDSVIPEWFVKGAEQSAGEAWDYLGAVKDLTDLAGFIPEDSPIGGIMDVAGIIKDGLENFGMGDNAAYAGIKSFLSNKFKGAIFDKNPGLVIMDALTTIFAGGTGAGDIISPGKTIQGSANFVIDKLTDLVNGTDDAGQRLDGGKYGGVLKITDETTELIADAVYNPEEFSNDFENAVTSDDFYDGMYQTNQDLWKPKEGSWFIKRAGCYAGEKTFEGLIKVADGVHVFSSWLGSKFGG